MDASPTQRRAVFFVDGFNLYHSIRAAEAQMPGAQLKWINVWNLCQYFAVQMDEASLSEVRYLTAFAEHLGPQDPFKVLIHKRLVRALSASGVKVYTSRFRKKRVWCEKLGEWIPAYEEKETDVAIACHVLTMAHSDLLDIAVIVSGDTDYTPLRACFRDHFPKKTLLFGFPFLRISKELRRLCPDSFAIGREAYSKNQFPDDVRLPSKKFVSIPKEWKGAPASTPGT
jgi:uncharacterized LabA/DUF88 family protein